MPRRKLSETQRQISLERQRQLATERKRQYRSCVSYRQAERMRDAVARRLLRSRPFSTASVEDASDEPSTSRSLQQTVPEISRSNTTGQTSNSSNEPSANIVSNTRGTRFYRDEEREKTAARMRLLRQNQDYKLKEQAANKASMKKRRACDEEYRTRERTAATEAKQQRREADFEYRERERTANAEAMRHRRRTGSEYQERERIANTEAIRQRRQTDPEYQEMERIANALAMRLRRQTDPEYQKMERIANAEAMRQRRQADAEYQERERIANAEAMRQRRQTDSEYQERERVANAEAMRQRRETDFEYREEERFANAEAMRQRRETDYREMERLADADAKQQRRATDFEHRERERITNAEAMRQRRAADLQYRENEREMNSESMRVRREVNFEYRQREREANNEAMRIRRSVNERERERQENALRMQHRRNVEELREEERVRDREAKQQQRSFTYSSAAEVYENAIKEGPTYTCNCCGRLEFKRSVTTLKMSQLLQACGVNEARKSLIKNVFYLQQEEECFFCKTCAQSIKCWKQPRYCLSNGLHFPVVDQKLQILTRLEERLVAARHIFQTIWPSHGPSGQYRCKGGIVNVPVSVDTTVSLLPRLPTDTHVVHVRVARRMQYKGNYVTGNVRPNCIWQAAVYLTGQPLYQSHNIAVSDNWLLQHNHAQPTAHANIEPDENEEEDAEPVDPGAQETMLTAEEGQCGIRMAPAEGHRPLSILLDEDTEYLSFPTIFGGNKLQPVFEGRPMSYSDIAKSFAMRYDRRVAQRPDYLLFMAKKIELLKLSSNHDDAYRVLAGVRNSCTHWHNEKQKVLAMVRQFGLPTFFLTISAAETQWPELLQILKRVIDHESVTSEEALALSYAEKSRLIQSDPVTCARYFNYRYQEQRKLWDLPGGPFEGITIAHSYYRVEFQQRGSPHIHQLLWLANAPVFDTVSGQNESEVCNFIDRFIACSSTVDHQDQQESSRSPYYLQFQHHRHAGTCGKRRTGKCRFGIPFYPMRNTRILRPLAEDTEMQERERLTEVLKRIKGVLTENEMVDNITFDEFLGRCQVTDEEYLLAIRAELQRCKVFLRRIPSDVMINPYSPKILSTMRSNMDLQYVLDPYACASYIIDYINKSDRGVSTTIEEVVKELRKGNNNLREAMQSISSVHYNSTEISAQEATYNILQLPMSCSSEQVIFIQTSPPDERVRIVKPQHELRNLDPASSDCFMHGLLEHYTKRPTEMERVTLADFAAWYNYSKVRPRLASETDGRDDEETENNDELQQGSTEGQFIRLTDGAGFVRRRSRPKVIRYRMYNIQTEPEQFYREAVMLYHPWRNEEEVIDADCEALYNRYREEIMRIRQQYHYFSKDVLDNAMEQAQNDARNREVDEEPDVTAPTFHVDNYYLDDQEQVHINGGMYERSPYVENFQLPNQLPNTEFEEMLCSLNSEQRDYVMHIAAHFKRNDSPLYHFITGGAGVGKSVLIRAIYQVLVRIFSQRLDLNPDFPSVLLSAPTGKAAFNIKGLTLHTLFQLPVNSTTLTELSADITNTMATRLQHLQVLIIDEISMVGELMLRMVNTRMRHLFGDADFGGKSVIAVGDFHQLRPVMAAPVCGTRSHNPYTEVFGKPLWHLFHVYKLTTVMRQNEQEFKKALTNLAHGQLTPADEALFQSRTFSEIPPDAMKTRPIFLFSSNAEVDKWNEKVLREMPGTEAVSEASDHVAGDGSESAKRVILLSVNNDRVTTQQTMGLPRVLQLKVGARYMMTYNLDTSDGLTNGATGRLVHIDMSQQRPGINAPRKPLRVWMVFDEPTVGTNLRRRYSAIIAGLQHPPDWTPLEPTTVTIKRNKSSNLQVLRKQFPMVPAEAITIHKSQGQTYTSVVVHTTRRMTRALLYVALSRVTSLAGLFIIGSFVPPKKPHPNDPLQLELQRQERCLLMPTFKFLHEARTVVQILYHNVQSFGKHSKQIENDPVFRTSDIMLLGETWTLTTEQITVTGFRPISRTDCAGPVRKAEGACCLISEQLLDRAHDAGSIRIEEYGNLLHAAFVKLDDTLIAGVYAAPGITDDCICQFFSRICTESGRILVIGDFNRNVSGTYNGAFKEMVQHFGLTIRNLDRATTAANTTLDIICSNFEIAHGTYVSLTSFHELIWARYEAARRDSAL